MRTRQQKLILDMTLHRISEDEFLRETRIARGDASTFALKMLEEAHGQKSEDDVECGLLLAFTFGLSRECVDTLIRLSDADWHHSHEDVVMALDELRDKRAIDAFYRAALKLHPYLEYDDDRALAGKAIWALGNLADPIADEKLRQLAQSDHAIVRKYATNQLHHRGIAK
jgi:FMN phosphatase YigB (HAD superfamily)